jgi:hypothetical protein
MARPMAGANAKPNPRASISVVREPVRWVTRIAAAILLTDVCNDRLRVFSLDLKRRVERILCIHGDVVDSSLKLKPDCKLHWRTSTIQSSGLDAAPPPLF